MRLTRVSRSNLLARVCEALSSAVVLGALVSLVAAGLAFGAAIAAAQGSSPAPDAAPGSAPGTRSGPKRGTVGITGGNTGTSTGTSSDLRGARAVVGHIRLRYRDFGAERNGTRNSDHLRPIRGCAVGCGSAE